jgi:hypothetical protein
MATATTHIIAGGTHFHVRPHLALGAPAYGGTGRFLERALTSRGEDVALHLTAMAGGPPDLDTNEDVAVLLQKIIADPSARILFLPVALCDFTAEVIEGDACTPSGKDRARLQSRQGPRSLQLHPARKLIADVRATRKDLFLVGFKTTSGATPEDQFVAGLRLLKSASCNLVLANDLHTRLNMVITPEQAAYHVTRQREEALVGLVEMALLRSRLTFTRTTVVPGEPVPWASPLVPSALRRVVDHCIERGAYKPFLGATVGHFAVRLPDGGLLSSRRKTDFNRLADVGLVRVQPIGDREIIAFGSRPSVGGQSQRIVFAEHPGADCIVHFHCPKKPGSRVPDREQRPYECGSHECGKNTSAGLARFGNIWAVMLERHGPNVVFPSWIDAELVIRFLEDNFDLAGTTAAFALPGWKKEASGVAVRSGGLEAARL